MSQCNATTHNYRGLFNVAFSVRILLNWTVAFSVQHPPAICDPCAQLLVYAYHNGFWTYLKLTRSDAWRLFPHFRWIPKVEYFADAPDIQQCVEWILDCFKIKICWLYRAALQTFSKVYHAPLVYYEAHDVYYCKYIYFFILSFLSFQIPVLEYLDSFQT